jgi:peptide/nickel transport system permease protein
VLERFATQGGYVLRYTVLRLGQAIFVMVVVTLLVAFAVRLSGDPVVALFQGASAPNKTDLERIRKALGVDRPFLVQYLEFVGGLLTGNLGKSFRNDQPVSSLINEKIPGTLILAASSLIFSIVVSVPLAIASAVRKGRWLDRLVRLGSLLGLSFPNFWLAIMMILIFGVNLRWLPPSGFEGWRSVIMPAVTLGLILTATNVRLLRAALLEVLSSQFITVARSKGLLERVVLYKHALRNAAIPAVTFIGLQFGGLIGGVVIIEQVFAWPGLGSLALNAISQRDYPVLQGTVAVLALVVVVVNLMIDLSYGLIDPRINIT